MDSIAGPVTAGTVIGGLTLLIALAIIVEFLTDFFKEFIPKSIMEKTEFPIPRLISLVIGITLGLTVKIDILRMFGFVAFYPYVSYILAGLIAAGGSKGAHELISKIRASREDIG